MGLESEFICIHIHFPSLELKGSNAKTDLILFNLLLVLSFRYFLFTYIFFFQWSMHLTKKWKWCDPKWLSVIYAYIGTWAYPFHKKKQKIFGIQSDGWHFVQCYRCINKNWIKQPESKNLKSIKRDKQF